MLIVDESLNVIGYVITITESTSRRILTQATTQRNLGDICSSIDSCQGRDIDLHLYGIPRMVRIIEKEHRMATIGIWRWELKNGK